MCIMKMDNLRYRFDAIRVVASDISTMAKEEAGESDKKAMLLLFMMRSPEINLYLKCN